MRSLVSPQFSEDIHWIWICDSGFSKRAWGTDALESYFEELEKDGMAVVRAVVVSVG